MICSGSGRFVGAQVLVTGAASGIGASVARRFAAEGAAAVLADRNGPGVERVAEELVAAGAEADSFAFDQRDEESVEALFAHPRLARIDAVSVNAGSNSPDCPLEELSTESWDRIHAINLRGAFLVARAAIPALKAAGEGAVVFTASTSGLRAHPLAASYAASKAGLLGLSRSLAFELAPKGIRVNSVCPGAVRTPMVADVYGSTAEEMLELAASQNPLGRVAEPEDVAAAITFLASRDARHLTASELIVDGGGAARLG